MAAGAAEAEPGRQLIPVGRFEWERIVRRVRMPSTVKLVALTLSTYANRDGSRVHPGVAKLAATTCLSERATRGGLTSLRELGLVDRTFEGSSAGRRALADEYQLTYPSDLEVAEMLTPEERPARAALTGSAARPAGDLPWEQRHEVPVKPGEVTGSAARPAGDQERDHRHLTTDHRHLTTGTPAPRAAHQYKTNP